MTRDNNLLGKFELTGIPPAPRGTPQIEVTFEVDANGILKVSAVDKGTGKEESITITNDKGRLTPEEIERMVREGEEFKEQDELQRKRIESRNGLEMYLYSMKSQLDDDAQLGGKLDKSEKKTILDAVKEKMDWLESNGATATSEDFDEQRDEIQAIISPITAKHYGGGSGGAGAGDEPLGGHDEL